MPATGVTSPTIGPSLTQVWKPLSTVGVTSDATAPFALGMVVNAEVANVPKLAQFCRVGAAGVATPGSAGITNGVTVAAAGGNSWANNTGVALVEGDYVFLTTGFTTTP